jgi:hypothetical protein
MGFVLSLVALVQCKMVSGSRIFLLFAVHRHGLVRMLLKTGYRYVYISRKFAMRNGFIPQDAAPGHYGYSGLVK